MINYTINVPAATIILMLALVVYCNRERLLWWVNIILRGGKKKALQIAYDKTASDMAQVLIYIFHVKVVTDFNEPMRLTLISITTERLLTRVPYQVLKHHAGKLDVSVSMLVCWEILCPLEKTLPEILEVASRHGAREYDVR